MAAPRLDYKMNETVQGLMIELTSALVSMTAITREVRPDEIDHARDHGMAGLELAKRLLKQSLKSTTRVDEMATTVEEARRLFGVPN